MKLKLHRSQRWPEWLHVDIAKRNVFQRVAASTKGIITPGNIATLMGLALVLTGFIFILHTSYLIGGIFVVFGRLMDVVDGWLADRTKTKSPLGEAMDATTDKVITFLAVILLLVSDLAPWWVLLIVALPHIVISCIVFAARRRNRHVHPSRNGKTSMVLAWAGLTGLVLLGIRWFDIPVLQVLTYLILAGSVALASVTAVQYAKSVKLI